MRVCRRWLGRAATVALVLCSGLAQGCRCGESGSGDVAVVDGHPISFHEFWEEFKSRYDDLADPSTVRPEALLQMKAEVLRDLVRRRLLLEEARGRGIAVSEDAVSERVARIRDGTSGRMFQKILLEQRQDLEQFRRAVADQLLLEALYRQVTADAREATEEEVGAFYDEHQDEFQVPETVRMRQLMVRDRALAMDLLRRLRRRAELFPSLAEEHALSPEAEKPGRLETYRKGELPEALEMLAFSADAGRVAGPVETPYGFHLILVEKRLPARLPPLDELREEIRTRLLEIRREEAYARWIDAKLRSSDIRVHPSLKDVMLVP